MKPLNVLSLFDGMACGLVALKRAGIPVENYYASEIDKYAVQIAMKNHPEIQQLGDVKGWKEWNLPRIDLVMGGSPCQGFSVAGKGLNFDDPRSRLFFDFVDIRNHYGKINPDLKFLLENVRMKKEWRDVITEYMGVEPVEINSALVSAQNRKRLYWANWNIEQPEDRGLVLADILEDGDVDRDRLPDVRGAAIRNQVTKRGVEEQLNIRKDDKSNCVVPSYPHKLNGIVRVGTASDIKGHDSVKRIYSSEGDLPSLTTMQGGHRQPKVAIDFYLTEEQVKKVKFQKGAKQIKRKKGEFEYFYKEGSIKFPNNINAKSQALVAGGQSISRSTTYVEDRGSYRKLTPLECERLQTLEDGYSEGVSNTQRYKAIGNGWTVEVVRHILESMIQSP